MPGTELWKRPVSYGAVGATQAADLLQYPPSGYRPVERRARIGHGDARFSYAWTQALSWGIQKNSGFRVELMATPSDVSELTYRPVNYDASGEPVEAATISETDEAPFAPDGTALLAPGDTAMLVIPFGPLSVKAPARVVYVIDEPRRKGFAYGTLPGHPQNGEESFLIEHRDDGSVWIVICAFSRPSHWYWWLVYPVLRLAQEYYTRRYLRALAGPIDG